MAILCFEPISTSVADTMSLSMVLDCCLSNGEWLVVLRSDTLGIIRCWSVLYWTRLYRRSHQQYIFHILVLHHHHRAQWCEHKKPSLGHCIPRGRPAYSRLVYWVLKCPLMYSECEGREGMRRVCLNFTLHTSIAWNYPLQVLTVPPVITTTPEGRAGLLLAIYRYSAFELFNRLKYS